MGRINVPNSSVVFDNPKQVDQNTLVFSAGSSYPVLNNLNGASAGWVPVVAGLPWQPNLVDSYRGQFAIPQPNSFDPTPPSAPPVAVNKPAVAASDPSVGGTAIPGSSVTWRNPA
jgi:hypothetical protein